MRNYYKSNSHYLTYTSSLKNVGRMYLLSLGVKGLSKEGMQGYRMLFNMYMYVAFFWQNQCWCGSLEIQEWLNYVTLSTHFSMFLIHLFAPFVVSVLPEKAPFNVDNIRVAKILVGEHCYIACDAVSQYSFLRCSSVMYSCKQQFYQLTFLLMKWTTWKLATGQLMNL